MLLSWKRDVQLFAGGTHDVQCGAPSMQGGNHAYRGGRYEEHVLRQQGVL
jgi:hypothetical protein